jgi:TRAP-type C4-dicarboxylate transport system permease small subunit
VTIHTLTEYPVKILQAMAVALVGGIVLVVGGSVLLRTVGIVPAGATELATLLFLWAIYIGAFLAFLEGGHLAITALVNRLHGRVLTATIILSDVLLLVFTIAVTLESFTYVQLALDSIRVTPSLKISPAWMYSAVLVGMLLSSLYVIGSIATNVVRLWKGQEPPRLHTETDVVDAGGI